jgi:anti-sigma-K factor RskA
MMAYSEDDIALAAEYALGTLDADERLQVDAMMAADKDFAALVEAWQHRLGALNQMVGSIEPPPEVWERIKSETGLAGPQAPLLLPETAPRFVQAVPAGGERPAVQDNSNVIALSAQATRWRYVANFMTGIAAVLIAMIAIGAYRPDLLPDRFRPKPVKQVAETSTPPAPAAPLPSAQYVAVLQREGGAPAFILTVDGATRNFTVRKLDAAAEPAKSFELWLISDKLPRPRSLGVIGDSDFTTRPVLASYDPDIVNSATYAVTVEQAGGSPDGNPHSAPVFTGKLIEAVPPATASPAR